MNIDKPGNDRRLLLQTVSHLLQEKKDMTFEQLIQLLRLCKPKLIAEVLMPDATLQSVATAYGLSRERVRQIVFRQTGQDSITIKQKFMAANIKFFCPICGTPRVLKGQTKINTRKHIYCSTACQKLTLKYDLNHKLECSFCGRDYFPLKNHKHYINIGSENFCSTFCYILFRRNLGEWSERNVVAIINNLNKFKKKEILRPAKRDLEGISK